VIEQTRVAILMGSANDRDVMDHCRKMLQRFDVKSEWRVLSAHRTPDEVVSWVRTCSENGVQIFIAAAGLAAHLAGVVAAHTQKPVIGVPLPGGIAGGLDALLSTVQMPRGVPVATVAVGNAGAVNAALLAVRILALSDDILAQKMREYIDEQREVVLSADRDLQES